MRVLVMALIGLSAATAAPAAATSNGTRLADREYIQLARCAGLARGSGSDTSQLDTAMRRAGRQLNSRVSGRGFTTRRQASLEMRRATGETRTALETELATRCTF